MDYVIYNGTLTSQVLLPLSDRGFQYGDGFFETMHFKNSEIRFVNDHLSRIKKACSLACMDFPDLNKETLHRLTGELIQTNKIVEDSVRIKLMIWRKEGGLYTPASRACNFLIQVFPFKAAPLYKEHVIVGEKIRNQYSLISSFKCISSMHYILAGIEMHNRQGDDILLLDQHDHVSECLSSNIYWVKDKTVYTPSLSTGCVDGIYRKYIIRLLSTERFSCHEGLFPLDHLVDAEFIFTSNVTGLSIIKQIDKQQFASISPIMKILPFAK